MTTTRPLIGLIGKARVGKDTVASNLIENHGFQRIAFADPLRDVLLATDPIVSMVYEDRSGSCGDPGCCGGPWEEEFPLRLSEAHSRHGGWEGIKDTDDGPYRWEDLGDEVRGLLQRLGTAVRVLDPEFWIRSALGLASQVEGPIVITDVRFPNEADAIRDAGGTLVRVVRPGAPTIAGAGHISETALDAYPEDLTVQNVGSLEDLVRATADLAERV